MTGVTWIDCDGHVTSLSRPHHPSYAYLAWHLEGLMQVYAHLETFNYAVSARVTYGSSAVLCIMHQM